MTHRDEEWLSALADDELHGKMLQQQVDALLQSGARQQRWEQYHAIREGLHGNCDHAVAKRLQQGLRIALAEEPTILAPRSRPSAVWRHAAGLAVAASVTAVAVLGVQHLNQPSGTDSLSQKQFAALQQGAPGKPLSQDNKLVNLASESRQTNQLAPYLVNHNEYSSSTNMHGMLPYVRIVGHGSQP